MRYQDFLESLKGTEVQLEIDYERDGCSRSEVLTGYIQGFDLDDGELILYAGENIL